LPLVFAEVEDLERPIGLGGFLQFALDADEALARGVNSEAPEVATDPFAPELFCDGERGAGTAEEVGDERSPGLEPILTTFSRTLEGFCVG